MNLTAPQVSRFMRYLGFDDRTARISDSVPSRPHSRPVVVNSIGMFCPQCNVEYRPGFTRCSDCGVDLVPDPPHFALAGAPSPAEPGDPNDDPFCSFWKGQDARVLAELCEVLDRAGISHKTVYRSDHLFHLNNAPAYEVGVPFSLYEKAEKVVQESYGTSDADDVGSRELAGHMIERSGTVPILPETVNSPRQDVPGPPTSGKIAGWFPEDATVKIWSTNGGEPSEFFVAALHENGINCRIDQQGSHAALFVLPQDANRAREILREIAEAAAPE